MSAMGKFDVSAFHRIANACKGARKDWDNFMLELNRDVSNLLLRKLIMLSPVDQGLLRESWQIKTSGEQGGNLWVTVIVNNTEYAYYVNYGHRQEARIVPGYWQGGRFVYDPSAKTFMTLSNRWVDGQFFVEKAIEETEKELPSLFEKRFIEFMGRYQP